MDDLISRQAAIDALGERPMVWMDSDYEIAQRNQYDMDKLAIEAVPSAQPEIIRCKDCKHWDRTDGMFPDVDGNDWHGCEELSAFVSASGDAPCTPAWWYCANAKRKEE